MGAPQAAVLVGVAGILITAWAGFAIGLAAAARISWYLAAGLILGLTVAPLLCAYLLARGLRRLPRRTWFYAIVNAGCVCLITALGHVVAGLLAIAVTALAFRAGEAASAIAQRYTNQPGGADEEQKEKSNAQAEMTGENGVNHPDGRSE